MSEAQLRNRIRKITKRGKMRSFVLVSLTGGVLDRLLWPSLHCCAAHRICTVQGFTGSRGSALLL